MTYNQDITTCLKVINIVDIFLDAILENTKALKSKATWLRLENLNQVALLSESKKEKNYLKLV